KILPERRRQPRSLCAVSVNLLTHIRSAAHRQFVGDPAASLPFVLRVNLPKPPFARRSRARNRVLSQTSRRLPAYPLRAAVLPSRCELGKAARCDWCDFSSSQFLSLPAVTKPLLR